MTNRNNPDVWIVGRGLYALNFAKHIKEYNNDCIIYLLTTDPNDFAGWSNCFSQVVKIKFDPISYFDDVYKIVGFNFIVPVGEETLFLEHINFKHAQLGQNKLHFAYEPKLTMPKQENNKNIQIHPKVHFHNKMNFMKLVEQTNLPLIKTFYPGDIMVHTMENSNFKPHKYLLKPIYSRGSLGQQIVDVSIGEPYTVPEKYILQKFVENESEYSIFCDIINSEIDEFVCYQCTAMYKGFSTKRKLITGEICSKLVDYINILLTHIKKDFGDYNGYLGVDFIESKGIFYPTDFNPRITNGIGFFNNHFVKKSNEIISIVPYLSNNFGIDSIKECFTTQNDMFSFNDPLPGIFAILLMLWYILSACVMLQPVEKYVESKVKAQIISFEEKHLNLIY